MSRGQFPISIKVPRAPKVYKHTEYVWQIFIMLRFKTNHSYLSYAYCLSWSKGMDLILSSLCKY